MNLKDIKCIVFDFAGTLYSGLYFNTIPAGCENWRKLFDTHIFNKSTTEAKVMDGRLDTDGIAKIISSHVGLDTNSIVSLMERGCQDLKFNQAVLDFAIEQKNKGTAIVLVTINMDIFSKVVVPVHNLTNIFDVIVNSFDHKETRKEILWNVAFSKLGAGITFSNSLLIDDKLNNVTLFRQLGGQAYQYQDDNCFSNWLNSNFFKG